MPSYIHRRYWLSYEKALKNNSVTLLKVHGRTPKAIVYLYDNKRSFDKKRELNRDLRKEPKQSLFFGDLFRKLLAGNSNYFTYLNGKFANKNKQEIKIPNEVRCYIKELGIDEERYYGEVVGSRLANYLGVKTVCYIIYSFYP